jgi:hypothetical protein
VTTLLLAIISEEIEIFDEKLSQVPEQIFIDNFVSEIMILQSC